MWTQALKIPTSEAHKMDNYSITHTGHTVVYVNNTEDPTRGCGSIQGKLSKVYTMDNFHCDLLSVLTLIKYHKTALFHPEHGVVIANATDVRYKNPLLLGNLRHGMFQVQMKTSRKAFKTYAQIASTPIPDVSTRPDDDTIIITQDYIDDFLDEPLQLQSKRTRIQVDKFTYPTTYIPSRASHKSRRSPVNSVRMVHHAARGHAFSAQYNHTPCVLKDYRGTAVLQ
jgi:hypothetical protein